MTRSTPRPRAALAAVVIAVGVPACSTEGSGARTIELRAERGFVPSAITIRSGDTVVFDNRTTRAHSVTGSGGAAAMESGRLLAYDSWPIQLDEPGTYVFDAGDDPQFSAVVEVAP